MIRPRTMSMLGCASATALMFWTGTAAAQIDEIIVSAEKRETNIQQTPIAMSALSGDTLLERQITGMESLMQSLPNVDFGLGLGQARIAIRGIGFDSISGGQEGRVAFHQDGVYYSRATAVNGGLFDIERVEVLRGPQGTLYGRNATGGVVNVITKGPGRDFDAYASITAGNYNQIVAEGALGGPLNEKMAGRFAFRIEDRGGYGENEVTGSDEVEDKHIYSLRGKLRFDFADNFGVTLVGDYTNEDDHANGYQFVSQNPVTDPSVVGAAVPRPLTGVILGGVAPREQRNETGQQTQNNVENAGISMTADLSLAGLDFVSITGYRTLDYRLFSDIDQTSADVANITQSEKSEQFSEEFRISQSIDRFDWVLGAYFFKESLETGNQVGQNLAVNPGYNPITNSVFPPVFGPTPVALDPRGISQMFNPYGELDTEAWAVFLNLHYQITDSLGIRLGARYSDETKNVFNQTRNDYANFRALPWDAFPLDPATACNGVTPPLCAFQQQIDEQTFNSFTPSVTVDFQPTDDIYLYATYSQGFKSGGFNVGNVQPGFTREKITDYEVGAKVDWAGGRLRTNIAAFYYEYEDIQSTVVSGIPPSIQVLNAPGADQMGVELEAIAAPIDNLELNLDFAWLDSEYKGPFLSRDTSLPWIIPPTDQGGNQLVYAPEITFGFGAQYTWLLNGVNVTLRGETKFKDDTYLSIFNRDYVKQEAFWKSNAFLTVAPEGSAWSVQAFVRNIGDETTVTAMNVSPTWWGSPLYGAYAPPRTYGVQLTARFN